jgi:hypothetical protein
LQRIAASPGSEVEEPESFLQAVAGAAHPVPVLHGDIALSKNDHLGLDQRPRVVVKVVDDKWKLD